MNELDENYEGNDEDGEKEKVKTEVNDPLTYCSVCESEFCTGSNCGKENCPW